MKKFRPEIVGLLAGALFAASAFAQGTGQLAPGQVWGNPTALPGPARPTTIDVLGCPTADNTGVTVARAALQACLNANKFFLPRDGTYRLDGELVLNNGQRIGDNPNATFRQYTRAARVFYGANLTDVYVGNVVLYGEGTFCGNPGQPVTSACPNLATFPDPPTGQWTGDGGADGRNGRGIQLDNCTNCRLNKVHTKNNGTAGIAIFGGKNITIETPVIEGTNLYSTPITSQGNFEYGLMLFDHPTIGAIDGLIVTSPNISGTAQAMLRANGGISTIGKSRQIIGGIAHDITGQHGDYGSTGNYVIDGFDCVRVANACIKNQIVNVGDDPYNFTATNISADTIGTNMFEITVLGGAGQHNIHLQGMANAAGRGLAVVGPVKNLVAGIQATNTSGEVVYISGDGAKDLDITLQSNGSAIDGVLVTATNADRIRFHHPIIRQPNTSNTGRFGFFVASASANVTIFDPVIADSGGLMVNGLINSVPGGTVKVFGSAAVTGASGTAVFATAAITAWPVWTTLSGAGGSFTGAANITNPDLGSAAVPFGSLHLLAAKRVEWNSAAAAVLATMTESSGSIYFQDAASWRFGAAVAPVSNRTSSSGLPTIGWLGLYLDGSSGGTGLLAAPPNASGLVWSLPAATTTLIGTTETATVVGKSMSGSANTFTNIGNASLTNSSFTINGTSVSLGGSATVGAAPTGAAGGDLLGSSYPNPIIANNTISLAKMATQLPNTILANVTSGTTVPAAVAVGSCSGNDKALQYVTNSGFSCNIAITAASVPASGLTGTTLPAAVTASSLTSLGVIASLNATAIASGTVTITSASASGLTAGPNGATNPTFKVDGSTPVAVTGVQVKSAAIGGGVFITATSSGTNEDMVINPLGNGILYLGSTTPNGVNLGFGGKPTVVAGTLTAASSVLSTSPTAGVGYTTGAGGTVTQATSKSTGVTLSKTTGAITLNNAALAAGTIVSFVLTNTAIAPTDVLLLNHISGGTPGSYTLNARCAAGSATIDVRNETGGSLSEAIVIQFVLIKGSITSNDNFPIHQMRKSA